MNEFEKSTVVQMKKLSITIPKTKTPMILAVGRLVALWKGYVSLLRALPLILKEHENAKLVIVGRGHMKKKLLKIAEELGVSQSLFHQECNVV